MSVASAKIITVTLSNNSASLMLNELQSTFILLLSATFRRVGNARSTHENVALKSSYFLSSCLLPRVCAFSYAKEEK